MSQPPSEGNPPIPTPKPLTGKESTLDSDSKEENSLQSDDFNAVNTPPTAHTDEHSPEAPKEDKSSLDKSNCNNYSSPKQYHCTVQDDDLHKAINNGRCCGKTEHAIQSSTDHLHGVPDVRLGNCDGPSGDVYENRMLESNSISGNVPSDDVQDGITTTASNSSVRNYGACDSSKDTETGITTENVRPSRSMTARKWFTIVTMCFTNLCSASLYSLLAPFFPPEAEKKGASSMEVGLIFASYQFICVCVAPIYGRYITTIGSKFMLVAGIFVCSTCAVMFGFLDMCPNGTIFVAMCFAVRSVEALGGAASGTASSAIIANTFPETVSTMMGVLSSFSAIGLMVGPPLGGFLYSVGGYRLPFFLSGGVFMLATFTTIIFLPKQNDHIDRDIRQGSCKVLRIPIIWIIGSYLFVCEAIIGFIDVTLANHLKTYGLSELYIGLMFLIPPVSLMLASPVLGKINDRYGYGRVMLLFGATVATGGFLMIGPSPLLSWLPKKTLWVFIVGLTVGSLGWGANVVTFRICLDAARAHGFPEGMSTSGLVSGVYNSFNSLGALTGPLMGGVLVQYLQFPWSSTIMAGLGGAMVIVLLVYSFFEYFCTSACRTNSTVEDFSPDERQGLIQNSE